MWVHASSVLGVNGWDEAIRIKDNTNNGVLLTGGAWGMFNSDQQRIAVTGNGGWGIDCLDSRTYSSPPDWSEVDFGEPDDPNTSGDFNCTCDNDCPEPPQGS